MRGPLFKVFLNINDLEIKLVSTSSLFKNADDSTINVFVPVCGKVAVIRQVI